ncbi:pigl [Symbiodinium necroappetens]|uniref:Pigl protein n=1 Tax=Symbiodinium necroappetens TaxID=1628268 RepID=A0A812YUP9_9DINO|nr:pigl [Symbiodinium necroappetens]
MERLCSGDNLRLGGSARTYVYREPTTAIQLSTKGVRLKTPGLSEQELPEPPLDSPRLLPGKPSPQISINLGTAKPQESADVVDEPAMQGPMDTSPDAKMSAAAEDDARKVPPGSPEDQEAVLAALESLVATTGTETKTGRPAEAPKAAQTKAAKKRSSSSSSEDKRKSKSKKRKSSTSSSSSRRKRKSKSKKRSSSSTSASREKAKRKSKKKSSSSS